MAPVGENDPSTDGDDATFSIKPGSHEAQVHKRKIYKNLFIVSAAFLCLFTAFQSLSNLQSSLNPDEGLGLASLSVIYASLIVSCLFLPPLVIGRLGLKWTLICSMSCYVLYTVANYHARWWTLIPSSILLGLAAAPLWSAKCAYLTTTGITYSRLNNEHQDAVVTRFFGIFFLIFQSGQIWGNLISSLVLNQSGDDSASENVTKLTNYEIGAICGASDCGMVVETNATTGVLHKPEHSLVIMLLSIYVATGCTAILILFFLLDKLKSNDVVAKAGNFRLLAATLRLVWEDNRMKLIIPLTIYSGLEQAFIVGDYTKSYVTCALGIDWIGFVMICFGVTDAVFSYLLGKVTKYTGRIPVFLSGFLVHTVAIITMLSWSPDPDSLWVFFALTLLWGFTDAVWQTQINALYGVLFHENQEAAFSNYRLWESLGFLAAFGYSNYFCVYVKLYVLLTVLITGIVLYLVVEYIQRNRYAANITI